MAHPASVSSISFKGFLLFLAGIFAVAAVLLIILSASASTGPASAVPLVDRVNRGVLGPGEQSWFEFTPAPGQASQVEQFLTLIFTPDDGQRARNVSLQLFEAGQITDFSQGRASKMAHFGAGRVVSRDTNPETGELFWTGWLFGQNTYYIQLVNGSEVTIDYWLFPADVVNYTLGEPPVTEPQVVKSSEGDIPQQAIPLRLGINKGELDPGKAAWYRFQIFDLDQEYFEEMALTMVATPDDGQRIRNMTLDVFTADDVQYWSPDQSAHINYGGAGKVVYRDENPLTGERFWRGSVAEHAIYFVQLRNEADVRMNYWLFPGKVVVGPDFGTKAEPVAAAVAEPILGPASATALEVGANRGRLNPGEERWYTFSRCDGEKVGQGIGTTFTMLFTPDDGQRSRNVNFELYEGQQLRDWAPDNRFNLISFGQGSLVNRDGDPNTGELLWAGHVLSGNRYYMRISNETNVVIDYWLHPEDVINVNLD